MLCENRYLIDFWGGSHGRFLEYVINCWIFNCRRTDKVFSQSGTCHGPKADQDYLRDSVIVCGHFSQFDIELEKRPEKIIRIVIDDFVGMCCYQINVIHRAGDIPKKEKEVASISPDIFNSPQRLRSDYFAKFSNNQHAYGLPDKWKFLDVSGLEVNMSSLYDFFSFMQTLKNIADFLEQKFSPDQELFDLWQEFIARNQGWRAWDMCNQLLKDIIANRDREINLEIEQQALLNLLLARVLGLFDGDLFDRPNYPLNTREIHTLVRLHLDTFDARF
jgi:hypothetical protein